MKTGSRQCLILANPKAGALSRYEAMARLRERCAHFFGIETKQKVAFAVPPSLEMLTDVAEKAGVLVCVEAAPPLAQLTQRLHTAVGEGIDTIVAVGGDGTVETFVKALLHDDLHEKLTLGILPLGTANNVARALNIPFELESAMRLLVTGVEQRIDIGQITNEACDEYFVEAAGIGLFADAVQEFGAGEVRPWQIVRLLRVLVPLFWNVHSRTLSLKLDGVPELDEATLVMIANSPFIGEGFTLTPHAKVTDGVFDILIVGALSRSQLLNFLFAVWRGTHMQLPYVRRVQSKQIEIRRVHSGHRPLPIHADDHIVAHTPVTVTTLPHAIRVIIPSNPN